MKLLIVRHGDPDYSIDSLTPTGWKEAELLSHRLQKLDVKAFYSSPLGRARETGRYTLEKLGLTAVIFDKVVIRMGMDIDEARRYAKTLCIDDFSCFIIDYIGNFCNFAVFNDELIVRFASSHL